MQKLKLVRSGLFLLVGIFIVGLVMLSAYRKELPYSFEVVPLDSAVGIISTTSWNTRDLLITYKNEAGDTGRATLGGNDSELIISGLHNAMPYTFTVSRRDLLGRLKYTPQSFKATPREENSKYIVLVGASVGRHWHFPELSQRISADKYGFGYRGKGSFDKEDVIIDLMHSKVKPDAIIIKQCAAYFPRDLDESKKQIDKWVKMISSENIAPILSTCVPVTQENDAQRNGRQSGIIEYNHFIRSYAERHNLPVLDLEKALRDDTTDSYFLKKEFATTDGLHLNNKAYSDALDPIVLPTLNHPTLK